MVAESGSVSCFFFEGWELGANGEKENPTSLSPTSFLLEHDDGR